MIDDRKIVMTDQDLTVVKGSIVLYDLQQNKRKKQLPEKTNGTYTRTLGLQTDDTGRLRDRIIGCGNPKNNRAPGKYAIILTNDRKLI